MKIHVHWLSALALLIAGNSALISQDAVDSGDPAGRVLVKMRPSRSPASRRSALATLARIFESEPLAVKSGATVESVSMKACGRVDPDWIALLRKQNPAMQGPTIAKAMVLSAPPCPYWRKEDEVPLEDVPTVSHQLLMHMGTQGEKTLESVARANDRSVASLSGPAHLGETLVLPYTTSYRPYRLKPEFRNNAVALEARLRGVPGFVSTLPRRQFSLITAASEEECPAGEGDRWPFSAAELRKVLEFNTTKRPFALRKAVIAVADTGIAEGEDRLFLEQNTREVLNDIDDDDNQYIDDLWGANMDGAPGFPARYPGYEFNEHGTHVSGIALGGLRDPELTKLIKDRISIRPLHLVTREVFQPLGAPAPITRFWIPNDLLLNAFQYAAREPQPHILNLSVEAEEAAGLDLAIGSTTALIVAAAGNGGINIDENQRYPAGAGNRERLISVAAHDSTGALTRFSNWGSANVDVAAPGCQIDSIVPEGGRAKINGTSQAAPLVSFTAALLYAEGLTIPQIKNRILLTSDRDPSKLGDCAAGHCVGSEGRLNLIKALSVYQDIVVLRDQDGRESAKFGEIKDTCIDIDGTCGDLRPGIKRITHDPRSQDRVWVQSRNTKIAPRTCRLGGAGIQFRETGAAGFQTVPMERIAEIVPAVRR